MISQLRQRNLQPELMDQPDLDDQSHRRALAALRRINHLSRSVGIVWPAIRQLALEQPGRPLRVLDVASGGGDVAVGLWRKAAQSGVALQITGIDVSRLAVEHGRELARRRGAPVGFEQANAVEQPLPAGFDVIMTSLFLHHLTRDDAVRLLAKMGHAARRLALVNDLRRSVPGYLLAHAVCQLVTRSRIVHVDGPRSVAGAFTLGEVRQMCAEAALDRIGLERRWPLRFLLSWEPNRQAQRAGENR